VIGYPTSQDGAILPAQDCSLIRKKRAFFFRVIDTLSTKLVRPRWLNIGLDLFLRVYGPQLRHGL